MIEYNVQETIDHLNMIMLQEKEKGKREFGLKLNIADNSTDIIGYITNYYNSQLISCKMKYCVLEKDYEIIIWW